MEGMLKMAFTGIGMALELFASTDYGHAGKIVFWGDIQHVTMYLFFFISGLCDVFCYFRLPCAVPGLDYAASVFAFLVEFILFKFHLHGRTSLDVLVHTFLLYAVAGCIIATLIELKHPNSELAGYTRSFFVLLQGTWFIQVGLILYPPFPFLRHWDGENHEQMMLATMMFAWHMAGVVILMMAIVAISRQLYTRYCWIRPGCQEYDIVGEETRAMMETPFPMSRSFGERYERLSNGGRYEEFENTDEEDETVIFDHEEEVSKNGMTNGTRPTE